MTINLDSIHRLKRNEPKPASTSRSWCYLQSGGKDPQIKLHCISSGLLRLTIIVRPNSVYFSYTTTVDLQTMEEALVLIRDGTNRLNQESEA